MILPTSWQVYEVLRMVIKVFEVWVREGPNTSVSRRIIIVRNLNEKGVV